MKTKIILAAIFAAYALPAAAKTKPPVFVEAAPVKDGKDVKLDPAKAYVMLRMPGATAHALYPHSHRRRKNRL